VLDIGCGEGYGAHYLAEFAASVKGIDYDAEIINYATDKYKNEFGISYIGRKKSGLFKGKI
jgi:2-polyprenyl-3-methyl-5-hydroxy-6-metoxy-1,4-benzoquinol methylase